MLQNVFPALVISVFLITQFPCIYSQTIVNCSYDFQVTEASVNVTYKGAVTKDQRCVLKYKIDPASYANNNSFIRVEATSANKPSHDHCPAVFTISYGDYVGTILLPDEENASPQSNFTRKKTLCFDGYDHQVSQLFVEIHSCNPSRTYFTINLKETIGHRVELNELQIVKDVYPYNPTFYHFTYPRDDDVDFFTVLLESTDDNKTFISIQSPKCPVYDDLKGFKEFGRWYTMSKKRAITVKKEDFLNGFHIIIIPELYEVLRTKIEDVGKLTFTIVHNTFIPWQGFVWPAGLYTAGIIVCYVMYALSHGCYNGGSICGPNFCDPGSFSHLVHRFVDFETPASYKSLRNNSLRFLSTTIIGFFFYLIPVGIFSVYLYKLINRTGAMDECNINEYCAYPVWWFTGANHMYAGLGFILCGLTYSVFVCIRDFRVIEEKNEVLSTFLSIAPNSTEPLQTSGSVESANVAPPISMDSVHTPLLPDSRHREISWKYWCNCLRQFEQVKLTSTSFGMYQNLGIYKAQGIVLICTGIFIVFHQICPNKDTEYFGLTFLFINVVLSQVKMYSLRRPDVVTDVLSYLWIFFTLVVAVVGYLISNWILNVVLVAFLGFLIILLICGVFVNDGNRQKPKLQGNVDPRLAKLLCCYQTTVFVVRIAANVLLIFSICYFLSQMHFFAQIYLLYLGNFLLEFALYYLVNKYVHGEYKHGLSWQPVIYLVFSIVSWFATGILMYQSFLSYERETFYQQECIILFFDWNDLYHMTLAPTWFFTLMVMLTADDEICKSVYDQVPVF